MPSRRLKDFLDRSNVKYVSITHSRAYTAQEIAAMAHVPGKALAKTVLVWVDDNMAMAVLPASYRVDKEQRGRRDRLQRGKPHGADSTEMRRFQRAR